MKILTFSVVGVLAGVAMGWFGAIYVVELEPEYEIVAERHSPDGSNTFQVLSSKDGKKTLMNFVLDGKTFVRFDTPVFRPSYHAPVVDVDWVDADHVELKIDQDFGEDVKIYRLQLPSIVKIKEER